MSWRQKFGKSSFVVKLTSFGNVPTSGWTGGIDNVAGQLAGVISCVDFTAAASPAVAISGPCKWAARRLAARMKV